MKGDFCVMRSNCYVPDISVSKSNNIITEELKKILWEKYYKLGNQQNLLSAK